jgi:predicted translin family RNA/ssDNA-binding protein
LCVLIHSLFVLSCRSTLIQVAALEACEKEKKKAEEQIEELMKKLAKFEKDMAFGAQVCNTYSLLCGTVTHSLLYCCAV